tara:strand:- start:3573 stop:4871 length:1299 start_codon:yes stop_codon:yes gene_type:complete
MILKGSQRAGGTQLAIHLLKTDENEHAEIHEIRGFMGDTPMEAFNEAYAISRGTKCQQFLFSLSLSPPETESVPVDVFEQAISDIEKKIGLAGQPRVIVFHEKEGRRHAHCVWSRIDVEKMRAINLPHFKLKLRDISRELYLEHGWKMPQGLLNSNERNPLNFTQAEWQQAKRIKQDPRVIKQAFQDCWAISDSRAAFASALKERGYYLAKGDRRGFVAVDWRGEVYPISRWVDIKTKEVKSKLGNLENLPSVEETKRKFAAQFTDKLQHFADDAFATHEKAEQDINERRQSLAENQRHQRDELKQFHTTRWIQEAKARSSLLPTGLKALWFRVTGKYKQIKKLNEVESLLYKSRDQSECQKQINQQLRERRKIQHNIRLLRHQHGIRIKKLNRDIGSYLKLSTDGQVDAINSATIENFSRGRKKQRSRDFS